MIVHNNRPAQTLFNQNLHVPSLSYIICNFLPNVDRLQREWQFYVCGFTMKCELDLILYCVRLNSLVIGPCAEQSRESLRIETTFENGWWKALGIVRKERRQINLNVILIETHLEKNISIPNGSENKINTFWAIDMRLWSRTLTQYVRHNIQKVPIKTMHNILV